MPITSTKRRPTQDRADLERWTARYNDADNPQALAGYRHGFVHSFSAAYLQALLTRLDASGRVVDIGCGAGQYLELLDSLGFEAVGVDFSPTLIAAAEERLRGRGIELHVGAVEKLPLPDASMDVALCMGVLQHVQDIDGAFRETRRILCRGGLLLFEVRNRHSLFRGLQRLVRGSTYREKDAELRNFDHRETRTLLEKAGFGRIRFHGCYLLPPPLHYAARLLQPAASLADRAFPVTNRLSHNFWFSARAD